MTEERRIAGTWRSGDHDRRWPLVAVALAINAGLIVAVVLWKGIHAGLGAAGWSCVGWAIWLLRPGSVLQRAKTDVFERWQRIVTVAMCAITIAAAVLPMSLSKTWNGVQGYHRNEYEVLADALLAGKVNVFDGEDTSAMQALDDPYDPDERKEKGVVGHFDYAYYNGKYYVYFGIVPALLLFMPYRAITGQQLTGYHATQVFTAIFIVALFALFLKMLRAFRLKMPFGTYLALCVASSIICTLCAMLTPSLYCTANTSAMAFQFWSFFFFIDAVWCREGKRSQIPVAMAGALCGALVFGCRPIWD